MGTGRMFDFFNTMIWNTKQRNLVDDQMIRSKRGLYIATISPLVFIPVYDPPPLENCICDRRGSVDIVASSIISTYDVDT